METKKKVLLIGNDALSQRRILTRFFRELSDAEELKRRNVEIRMLGLNHLTELTEGFDIVLLAPSVAIKSKKIQENFAPYVVIDTIDFLAYGTCNSELVEQQIIDILENGRRPKNRSKRKLSLKKKELATVFARNR